MGSWELAHLVLDKTASAASYRESRTPIKERLSFAVQHRRTNLDCFDTHTHSFSRRTPNPSNIRLARQDFEKKLSHFDSFSAWDLYFIRKIKKIPCQNFYEEKLIIIEIEETRD